MTCEKCVLSLEHVFHSALQLLFKIFLKISVFCHNVNEICAFLGFYVEQNGNSVLLDCLTFEMGPIGCPKTLIRNYQSTLCKIPEQCISFSRELYLGHTTYTELHTKYSGSVCLDQISRITCTVLSTQWHRLVCLQHIAMKFNKTCTRHSYFA
jgi:hypothetical protein